MKRMCALGLVVVAAVGCGGKGGSGNGGSGGPGVFGTGGGAKNAKLRVGQFAHATAGRSVGVGGAQLQKAAEAGDAPVSTGPFSFAKVDGLRLSTASVNLTTADNRYVPVAFWPDGGKPLEVGDGVSATFGISEDVSIPPGEYTGATLRFDAAFDVKAYCRTATKLVYTTATQVKALDCAGCSMALPSDYDYYHSPFAYVTTADSPTSTTDMFQESSSYTFSVSDAGTPAVSVLVDDSFVVDCYDGTVALGAGYVAGGLSPFTWSPRHGALTDYFPSGAPAMGIAYLPMFTWVSDDAAAVVPTAETYVASGTEANVFGSALDFSQLLITTTVFKDDATLLAMRSRNFDAQHGTGLNQMYEDFTQTDAGVYDMANGEWYWNADAGVGRLVHDRKVVGFQRQADFDAGFATTIEDGPDCGATLIGEFGNVARPCGPVPSTVYWRRIQR